MPEGLCVSIQRGLVSCIFGKRIPRYWEVLGANTATDSELLLKLAVGMVVAIASRWPLAPSFLCSAAGFLSRVNEVRGVQLYCHIHGLCKE